ncbi:MAG TPA: hypothetical protein VJS19_10160 [Candidatus Dormibacteraeota bacterium]|nr:hypothetical protein [Candidatus Dormibacteraeota bacterium]
MLAQVLASLTEAVEWDAMPEPAGPSASEQPLAHRGGDRAIGSAVIRHFEAVRPDNTEPLIALRLAALDIREHS